MAKGPYHAIPSSQTKLGVTIGDKRWLVIGTDGVGCIYGTEGECKDIRDVLNRHHALNHIKERVK